MKTFKRTAGRWARRLTTGYGRTYTLVAAYFAVAAAAVNYGYATPQFARQTHLKCSACHTHVPLLNAYGQQFYANGFKLPKNHQMFDTIPVWAEVTAQPTWTSGSTAVPVSWDDTSIHSTSWLPALQLIYMAEWHPSTQETDLQVVKPFGQHFAVAGGNINAMGQFDPGLDITLSTPVYLAPLPTGPNNVQAGPFSPSGSIIGVRGTASLGNAMPYGDGFQLASTVLFSFEQGNNPTLDTSTDPQGTFLELFDRHGMDSVGINTYLGRDGRHYYGAVGQKKIGSFYLQGGGAYAQGFGGETRVASLSADFVPHWDKALALRVDNQDGLLSLTPTASWLLGGQTTVYQIVGEGTFLRGSKPSATLYLSYKF